MDKFHIRRVIESDVAIGEGLIQAAFLDEFKSIYGFSPNIEVMKATHSASWRNGFVLVDDKDVIHGAIGGVIFPNDPETLVQSVWFLRKDVRRFAWDLLKTFEQHGKSIGAKRMIVTCMGADRLDAKMRAFRSAGFRLVETKFCKEII